MDDDPEHQPVGNDIPGYGLALQAAGLKPSLVITDDTPGHALLDHNVELTQDAGRLPIGARLLDGQGVPIEGALIHFDLQASPFTPTVTAPLLGLSWSNLWEVAAVTGPDGVASASLPLFGTGAWVASLQGQIIPMDVTWRALATYDGGLGLYPRHAAKGLTLG